MKNKAFLIFLFLFVNIFAVHKKQYLLISKGKEDNQFNIKKGDVGYLAPLDFDIGKNGSIYFTDNMARSIKIFNSKGELIKHIENERKWLPPARDISVDYNNNILLYSGYGTFVKLNSKTGKIIFKREDFSRPTRIWFDQNNNIILEGVPDEKKYLTPEGEYFKPKTEKQKKEIEKLKGKPVKEILNQKLERRKKAIKNKKLQSSKNKIMKVEQKIRNRKDENKFHKSLLAKKLTKKKIEKNFKSSGMSYIGTDEEENTYFETHGSGVKETVITCFDKYGYVKGIVYEDYSDYIKFIVKLGKDGNLYAYTPHKDKGVIIWKYEFD